MLDSGAEGPGFKLQPRRSRVTILGKLFTPIVPLFTKQQSSSPLKGCGGNCGPGRKPTARFIIIIILAHQHKACRQLKIKQEMTAYTPI